MALSLVLRHPSGIGLMIFSVALVTNLIMRNRYHLH